jgi:hypothetical protein
MRGIISKCSNFLNMGREQTWVTTCILKEAIQSVNNFSFLLNPQQQEYGRSSQLVFMLLTRSMETAQPDSTPDFASCGQYNKLTKEQQHFCTKVE